MFALVLILMLLVDEPFGVEWKNEWERPWRFDITFEYRTEGVDNKAVALLTQPLLDDGSRAPTQLWPNVRTGRGEDTYVLGASDAFRSVLVGVDLPNVIRKKYRFEWDRRFVKSGKVVVRNFKVSLVTRAIHKFHGGEYPIRKTKSFDLKNIFFDDRGAVDVDFAFPQNRPECRVAVKDVKGRTIQTVQGSAARAHLDFPHRGWWELEATANYPGGSRIVTTSVVAVCGRPISRDLVSKSRYGMMIVLGTGDLWEKLGSRWNQRFVMADSMKNRFDVPAPSADVVFSIHNSPVPRHLRRVEERDRQGQFPPEDWEAFRAYIGRWFDAQPQFLEHVGNITGELDFQWRETDAEYVKMCRIFVEEARRRNPKCFLTGPEASRIKLPYFRRLFDLGYFDLVDGVNVHHYVDGTKPEGEYWEDFTALFDFMREHRIDKPVYVTESGWTVEKGNYFVPVTPENQARYLTRAMAMMSTENIKSIIWHVDFTMRDGFGAIRKSNEAAFSKPMLQAFATLTRNLTDVEGNLRLHRLDERTYLVSGTKPSGSFVHVWWRSSGERRARLPVAGVTAAEDYLGSPVAVASGEAAVSEDPIYIFSVEDYSGPEWKEPPGGVKRAEKVPLKADWQAGRMTQGVKSAKASAPFPAAKWSDPATAPELRIGYARDAGFVIEAKVADRRHCQPYSRERVVEGDSLVVAFDVDKTEEWRANDIFMNYKGHRCVEYSAALTDVGTVETFRHHCWIPDLGSFESVGANVRASVRREDDGTTVYWMWIPWANLGLDERLRPGSKVGFAAALYFSDGGEVKVNRLFDGIAAPLDPMKYGVIELETQNADVGGGEEQ